VSFQLQVLVLKIHGVVGYRRENVQWGTYRYREPGPYWPDTGKAQMTCRAVLVAFVALRVAKVFKRDVEESAGMTSHSSSGSLRREWLGSEDKVPSRVRGRARSLGSDAVGICQGREGGLANMEKSILFSYIKDPGISGRFGQQKDSGISIRCGRCPCRSRLIHRGCIQYVDWLHFARNSVFEGLSVIQPCTLFAFEE
jgi:hypothetical protein